MPVKAKKKAFIMDSLGKRKKITSYILYTKQIFETIQVANFAILWPNQPICRDYFLFFHVNFVWLHDYVMKNQKDSLLLKLPKHHDLFCVGPQ